MKKITLCLLTVIFCIGLLLGCNQNSAENSTAKTTGDIQTTSSTQMTQSTVPVAFDPYALAAQIPEEVQEKMKVDALSQFDPFYPYPEGWMPEVGFAVYGAFGDVYALFIDGFGVLDYISSEFVDGIEIAYPNSRYLYVYCDGYYYRLQEAMDAKIIDRSDLEKIVENYYNAHPVMNPDR